MEVRKIAEIVHEAVRAYGKVIGDINIQPHWDDAEESIKNSSIDSVNFVISNPDAGDAALHNQWMDFKKSQGWVYGGIRNNQLKQHPSLKPFEELTVLEQGKDKVFIAIVNALK